MVATRLVPITEVIERKRWALRAHPTAGRAFDVEATLGLNRWRSLATDAGRGHAEAFHAATWEGYVRAASLPSLR